jgi:hypothetical protein
MTNWNNRRWRLPSSLMLLAIAPLLSAQSWDIGGRLTDAVAVGTENRLKFTLEQRGRYESRTGNNFGNDVDVTTALIRTRFGAVATPWKWLKISAMMQDSRAPGFGPNAPNNLRDTADLQEAYLELFPSAKQGFGLNAGRMMLNYGEGRLIGTPQWGNVARTYDEARVYWRAKGMRLELMAISPVKVRSDDFNRPVWGERIWGTYNTLTDVFRKSLVEAYYLRHEQNRPGGFTGGTQKDGTDRMTVNAFGFRLAGPVAGGVNYSVEGVLEKGKVAAADLSAAAWYASVVRRWKVFGKPLDLSVEYKYASGTANPSDLHRNGTFDQMAPANHDKFGHEDLFGWRNLHNARSLATLGITNALALNVMYDDLWLVCLKDGIYNNPGRLIVRSATGTAGRHVGREADVFGTYKYKNFMLGAGYGHLFPGGFLLKTTPGVGPTYLYFFHTYTL